MAASEELLARIQGLVKELLCQIMEGRLPATSIDKFQLRKLDAASNRLSNCIFEKCEIQDRISLETAGSSRRLIAMLRALQIVQQLLQCNKHASKRDMYYTDPRLLPDEATVSQALNDICIHMNCTRHDLHVVSVSKGLVMGPLRFAEDRRIVDCAVCMSRGYQVPADITAVTNPSSCAEYILVVEKETVFQRLANDGFCVRNNCIVITGKGYPDLATRSFLKLLVDGLGLPVYGLVDADPYGLDILASYRFGSLTMAYDAAALATPNIRLLGLLLSDAGQYKVPDRCLRPLTARDTKKVQSMLGRAYLKLLAPSWWEQLKVMSEKGMKLEIEALSAQHFSCLGDEYIPAKIGNQEYL